MLNLISYYINQIRIIFYKLKHPKRTDVELYCPKCKVVVARFVGQKINEVSNIKRFQTVKGRTRRTGFGHSPLVHPAHGGGPVVAKEVHHA